MNNHENGLTQEEWDAIQMEIVDAEIADFNYTQSLYEEDTPEETIEEEYTSNGEGGNLLIMLVVFVALMTHLFHCFPV